MQWEGQQLQDGNRWLCRTPQLGLSAGYVPRARPFVVALKTTWAHLRLQIPGAAANAAASMWLHRWLGAAVGLSTTVAVHGSAWETCLPSAAHWVFMQEDACSLQELTGHLVAFLSGAAAAVSFAAESLPESPLLPFCIPAHMQRQFPEQGASSSSSSAPWHEALRRGMRMRVGLCSRCTHALAM